MPAGSKTDWPLAKNKPINDGGSTSGITELRRGKMKNLLFLKDCMPMKRPTLEQFLKNCSPWEGLMLEKFVEDCLPWEGPNTGAGEECEESSP
ncbi:hypothetical protein GRJ2_001219000 [Grus japonensis]|uniref:Uncharacterized protein n=1 Tax=Grus japonensis TaxID=30415 RepID=A0ABC9WSS8_GRUJA